MGRKMITHVLSMTFPMKPKPVQSVQFRGKKAYQPNDIKQFKAEVKYHFRKEFPDFEVLKEVPLLLLVVYKYSMAKLDDWKQEYILIHGHYPKITRPDVTDNLNKGLVDALSGEIWEDDGIICQIEARKIYAPKTEIKIMVSQLTVPTTKKEYDLL
mgnify:CR=1 FL=1